jgi:hypothetical protein
VTVLHAKEAPDDTLAKFPCATKSAISPATPSIECTYTYDEQHLWHCENMVLTFDFSLPGLSDTVFANLIPPAGVLGCYETQNRTQHLRVKQTYALARLKTQLAADGTQRGLRNLRRGR